MRSPVSDVGGCPPPTVTDDEVAAFAERGFHAVERITTDDEVTHLRDVYDRVLGVEGALRLVYEDAAAPEAERARIEQIFAPELVAPELLETTYLANARVLAARVLGVDASDVEQGGIMLIAKPAGLGLETPFHQDEAYWDFEGSRLSHSASVWMPLDEVSVDSGCMQFMPGTHRGEGLLHHTKPDPRKPLYLEPPIDTSAAVPCPLPAGGATVHHCRTVHGTAPNTSNRSRRAITTIFHGPPTTRRIPQERPWLRQ